MDDSLPRRFFLEPVSAPQRQYEALRAVFVDGSPQKEAAARFGYAYDAFRQLVHQFRTGCAGATPPPFSAAAPAGGRRRPRPRRRPGPKPRPSPTSAP
jgi:hypothetical protein